MGDASFVAIHSVDATDTIERRELSCWPAVKR